MTPNQLRNKFFYESEEKAYKGHISDGDEVVWNKNYVEWLENKSIRLESSNRALEELFRNFIRSNHLSSEWDIYLKHKYKFS